MIHVRIISQDGNRDVAAYQPIDKWLEAYRSLGWYTSLVTAPDRAYWLCSKPHHPPFILYAEED